VRVPNLADSDADDARLMRRALALAARGWGRTSPNPLVGCVLARDGEVVGEGWHEELGGPHAEVHALRAAGERARGATAYVTLEPCAHHGRTPPCADALIAAGVARVVIAALDPNPVAAGGATRLRDAGIEVTTGVEAAAALELNAPFFHAVVSDRPWVTLKLAVSLDGAIAAADRRPAWLTGAESRREVHRLRAGHDAIAVGIGTALADDPSLTVREVSAPRVPPARVVFDRRARLPLGSTLARTARETRTLLIADATSADAERAHRIDALGDVGVDVWQAADLDDALRWLRRSGVRSLFVEGGAGIASALVGANLVDRLIMFHAPVLLGAGAIAAFSELPPADAARAARWRPLRREPFGDDLMTVYAPPHPSPT